MNTNDSRDLALFGQQGYMPPGISVWSVHNTVDEADIAWRSMWMADSVHSWRADSSLQAYVPRDHLHTFAFVIHHVKYTHAVCWWH